MSTPSDGRPARKPNPRTMRLPGSVAEVQASPPGPEIGAFFDLDGTLVAGFTGVLLTQDTFRRREIGIGEFLGVVQSALILCTSQEPLRTHPCCLTGGQVVAGSNPVSPTEENRL